MKPWLYLGMVLGSLWLQLTLAPHLALFGLKPNLMLLILLVVGIRWIDPWLFIPAITMGLAMDVFSHGVLGIYGISFLLISFLARYVGFLIYENSLWFTMVAVTGLSLAEGFISLSIFEILDGRFEWWNWLFRIVIPLAFYQGLLSSLLFYLLLKLEKVLKLSEEIRYRI